MAERRDINGQCLCGAVQITAAVADPTLVACHCDMCRRQAGGISMSLITVQEASKVTGPVKTFRSSDWAERAFCENCGSRLWYSTLHDGARYLAAGLFDNAAGATVAVEYFADKCPTGYALAGHHDRLTEKQTIALFTGENTSEQGHE